MRKSKQKNSPEKEYLSQLTENICVALPMLLMRIGFAIVIGIVKSAEILDSGIATLLPSYWARQYHLEYLKDFYPEQIANIIKYQDYTLGVFGHTALLLTSPIIVATYLATFVVGVSWSLCITLLSGTIGVLVMYGVQAYRESQLTYQDASDMSSGDDRHIVSVDAGFVSEQYPANSAADVRLPTEGGSTFRACQGITFYTGPASDLDGVVVKPVDTHLQSHYNMRSPGS